MSACLNPWPCTNPEPHEGGESGHGCVHVAAWASDGTHDDGWRDL
jgi:hypothetical protein